MIRDDVTGRALEEHFLWCHECLERAEEIDNQLRLAPCPAMEAAVCYEAASALVEAI